MQLPGVLNVAIALFFVQLLLCFKAKRPVIKWLPVILLGAGEVVCLLLTFVLHTREAGFGFFGLTMIGWVWLAGLGAAWLVYGIVRLVQKLQKKFGL